MNVLNILYLIKFTKKFNWIELQQYFVEIV